jgi:hypothetical protein
MLKLTERAAQAVAQADGAARRFNPDARVRLARDGARVRFELVEGPLEGDGAVTVGETTLYVAEGLEGTLDTGDHNVPVLLPTD